MSDTSRDADVDDRTYDAETDRDVMNTDAMQWVSALVAVLGLWLVASAFLFEATDQAIWNVALTGTGIFLVAGFNFLRMSRDRLGSVGAAVLAALLGLWMAASPFVMEMGSDEFATSTILSGLLVAAIAAYNAYANSKADVVEDRVART